MKKLLLILLCFPIIFNSCSDARENINKIIKSKANKLSDKHTYKPSDNRDSIVTEDELLRDLEYLKADFEAYDDYELMARRNSDNTTARFVYTTEDRLQDPNWKDLFNAEKGTVVGPYLARPGVYRIAKLVEVEYRPDSVEARHIMIVPTQQINLDSVQKILDELILKIENGSDFGSLAVNYSQDQASSIKGGDLGWFQEGTMVHEFNEVCFTSKKWDLRVVATQYGLHLIEVTGISKKVHKIKVAFIDKNLKQ